MEKARTEAKLEQCALARGEARHEEIIAQLITLNKTMDKVAGALLAIDESISRRSRLEGMV